MVKCPGQRDGSLAEANVQDAATKMMEFLDANGNPNPAIGNILLVPPKGRPIARKISESEFAINEADNNAINPQSGQYLVVTSPFLTNRDSWFMIDSTLSKTYLHWQTHTPLEITYSRDNQVAFRFQMYARYGYGWSDPHFVFGHGG